MTLDDYLNAFYAADVRGKGSKSEIIATLKAECDSTPALKKSVQDRLQQIRGVQARHPNADTVSNTYAKMLEQI